MSISVELLFLEDQDCPIGAIFTLKLVEASLRALRSKLRQIRRCTQLVRYDLATIIAKLSPDTSSLSYSTFLGTGGGTGIVFDSNLDAIITGGTDTPTFPVTRR